MPKPEPLATTSLRLEDKQKKFLEMTAKAQGHWNVSEVIRRLINREMGRTA